MRPTRRFLCIDCQHVWTTAFGAGRPEECPRCGSPCFGRLTWRPDDRPGTRGQARADRRPPLVPEPGGARSGEAHSGPGGGPSDGARERAEVPLQSANW